ncbi:hypothetical protein ACQ4LE_003235 [Meloidogyne hapla]
MERKKDFIFFIIILFITLPLVRTDFLDSLFGDDEEKPVSDEKATKYLQEFGYVSPGELSNRGSGGGFFDPLDDAIKKFQAFAHLPVTGKLDVKTKKKMAKKRCGMQDVEMISRNGASPFKWDKSIVTYTIHNFSPDLSSSRQRDAIRRAYQTWSAVIPVRFEETSGAADINVLFASGSHGDPWPFDGRGGVLAHATMPKDGKLHFDESENWALGPEDANKIGTSRYTDLYPVAVHEIGHTLGLSHSRVEDAIMAPFYQETVENGVYVMPRLKSDDIRAIQAIYGSGRGGSSSGFGGVFGSSGGNRFPSSGSRGNSANSWNWPSSSRGSSSNKGKSGKEDGFLDKLFSKWLG